MFFLNGKAFVSDIYLPKKSNHLVEDFSTFGKIHELIDFLSSDNWSSTIKDFKQSSMLPWNAHPSVIIVFCCRSLVEGRFEVQISDKVENLSNFIFCESFCFINKNIVRH